MSNYPDEVLRPDIGRILEAPDQIIFLVEEPLLKAPRRSRFPMHRVLDTEPDSLDDYAAKPISKGRQVITYTNATIDSPS